MAQRVTPNPNPVLRDDLNVVASRPFMSVLSGVYTSTNPFS